jgi:hypothetical protein
VLLARLVVLRIRFSFILSVWFIVVLMLMLFFVFILSAVR